jgi:amino acid transporter
MEKLEKTSKNLLAFLQNILKYELQLLNYLFYFFFMSQELRKNSLGTVESLIMWIAGTAPAFSIEATAFTIIWIAWVLAPASILISGLIMFWIAWAFIHLNKLEANAWTTFAWVTKIFGKTAWFFAWWTLLVLCCIFMVSATVPAANAILLVFLPDLVNNVAWVTWIAAGILTLVSLVVVKWIKLTSYAQVVLTIIEAIILFLIIGLGFYHFSSAPLHSFSWNWFSPFSFDLSTFIAWALVSVFFYYGWDVTMNLAEETKDPANTPEKATFYSMIFLILFFLAFITLILLGLTDAEIAEYNTNVIFALAEKLLGKELGYLAIIAVLLSTIWTIETQIIQFTRTMFAKSRSWVLHERYGRLHPTWQTPHIAIFFVWIVGIAMLYASSYLPTVNEILQTSISAMGYQICFYLGLTGFACAWYFRDAIKSNFRTSLTKVIWPFVSSSFLLFVLVYSIIDSDRMTNIIWLGGIMIGCIPFLIQKYKK